VINKLKPLAGRKGLSLYFVPHEKVQIYVDKNKLFRALINLINNSIKYTNDGSVRVEITTSKENVIIKVIDTGIGIPEDDIPYIFDRFYKVDKSRKRSQSSTGLGLSIVQEIIQMHEGKIFVKSEVNQGTSFNIILPKKTEL
jgi:signal transduction histidine kinase